MQALQTLDIKIKTLDNQLTDVSIEGSQTIAELKEKIQGVSSEYLPPLGELRCLLSRSPTDWRFAMKSRCWLMDLFHSLSLS